MVQSKGPARAVYPARGIPALILAIAFVAIGIYMVEVGRVMWTDSHNPRAIAQIDSRRCWTSTGGDGSSENLCDLVVTYRADSRTVRTSMKAADAGGIHGNEISVSYDPANVSDASGPENDSQTAFMAWGAAILLIGFGAWLLRSVIRQLSQSGHRGPSVVVSQENQAPFRSGDVSVIPEGPLQNRQTPLGGR